MKIKPILNVIMWWFALLGFIFIIQVKLLDDKLHVTPVYDEWNNLNFTIGEECDTILMNSSYTNMSEFVFCQTVYSGTINEGEKVLAFREAYIRTKGEMIMVAVVWATIISGVIALINLAWRRWL